MDFQYNRGGGCMKKKGCCKVTSQKLSVHDWLSDMPESMKDTDLVEVQFKNTRKGYYRNTLGLPLEKGDVVAVESSPGHDIGEVTLTGRLVLLQMKKYRVQVDNPDIKRVYRVAKPVDMEKYEEAKAKEHATMLRAREIAQELKLDMKIGDVEYQGDGGKAIFYYIADERVDFRQLIKVYAEVFRVRIEMKQIGARQEAGRIGGIGPCGRELCCSGWVSSFSTVSTAAARHQDISMNPQKLAGQCAKLKCCFNYEVDAYVEAQKELPGRDVVLQTEGQTYFHFKTDILKREITFSTDKHGAVNLVTLPAKKVFEIVYMNKQGVKPESLTEKSAKKPEVEYRDGVGDESLTRFDSEKKRRSRGKGRSGNGSNNKERTMPEGEIAKPEKRPERRKPTEPKVNQSAEEPRATQAKPAAEKEEGGAQRKPRRNNRNRNRPKGAKEGVKEGAKEPSKEG